MVQVVWGLMDTTVLANCCTFVFGRRSSLRLSESEAAKASASLLVNPSDSHGYLGGSPYACLNCSYIHVWEGTVLLCTSLASVLWPDWISFRSSKLFNICWMIESSVCSNIFEYRRNAFDICFWIILRSSGMLVNLSKSIRSLEIPRSHWKSYSLEIYGSPFNIIEVLQNPFNMT